MGCGASAPVLDERTLQRIKAQWPEDGHVAVHVVPAEPQVDAQPKAVSTCKECGVKCLALRMKRVY